MDDYGVRLTEIKAELDDISATFQGRTISSIEAMDIDEYEGPITIRIHFVDGSGLLIRSIGGFSPEEHTLNLSEIAREG